MERGLLSDERLGALYDDVVWMYLYQDFSHGDADRAAERVAIRFGITSWPQHFLVDPHSLAVLADTGRSLESFRQAVAAAVVGDGPGQTTAALVAADRLAATLEGDCEPAVARRHLDHDDVVVRYRAIQRLEQTDPAAVVAAADRLLELAHDQTRFLICGVLARAGDARANPRLEALVRRPEGSKNPNVLRIRAVQALARCGDGGSVAVIAPHAASGVYFNGLTGVAVDALAEIAARHPRAREGVLRALRGAFPAPPEEPDERALRACRGLAERVHRALEAVSGEHRPFPVEYDAAGRRRLVAEWGG